MAAAACGANHGGTTAKTHKEQPRKSKDSRRRQAALLFLNNISLDGRPVYGLGNGLRENWNQSAEVGPPAVSLPVSMASSCGNFSQLSPFSGAALPRTNTCPPAPLSMTAIAGFSLGGNSSEVSLESGRMDPLSSVGFSLPPTSGAQTPHPITAKSPAVVSGGNSGPPDLRQRWVLFFITACKSETVAVCFKRHTSFRRLAHTLTHRCLTETLHLWLDKSSSAETAVTDHLCFQVKNETLLIKKAVQDRSGVQIVTGVLKYTRSHHIMSI